MRKYGDTLANARQLLLGERNEVRGDPLPIYKRAADTFNSLTHHGLKPSDVTLLMLCVKLAREEVGKHDPDNFDDAAAYVDLTQHMKQFEKGTRP